MMKILQTSLENCHIYDATYIDYYVVIVEAFILTI